MPTISKGMSSSTAQDFADNSTRSRASLVIA
eukprot:CAMPEP_0115338774 /NCGR_PEP_ID=MMETSP0270-20121206/90255_1 /TAXON_ID=71861 /ORGANISM="Scrippsiella trochoidea, Strain CCMP3099" /LENGTH=30 /DNA_ID= /DNA_START= /DNA_END= /DNA_ORIENTATION=